MCFEGRRRIDIGKGLVLELLEAIPIVFETREYLIRNTVCFVPLEVNLVVRLSEFKCHDNWKCY